MIRVSGGPRPRTVTALRRLRGDPRLIRAAGAGEALLIGGATLGRHNVATPMLDRMIVDTLPAADLARSSALNLAGTAPRPSHAASVLLPAAGLASRAAWTTCSPTPSPVSRDQVAALLARTPHDQPQPRSRNDRLDRPRPTSQPSSRRCCGPTAEAGRGSCTVRALLVGMKLAIDTAKTSCLTDVHRILTEQLHPPRQTDLGIIDRRTGQAISRSPGPAPVRLHRPPTSTPPPPPTPPSPRPRSSGGTTLQYDPGPAARCHHDHRRHPPRQLRHRRHRHLVLGPRQTPHQLSRRPRRPLGRQNPQDRPARTVLRLRAARPRPHQHPPPGPQRRPLPRRTHRHRPRLHQLRHRRPPRPAPACTAQTRSARSSPTAATPTKPTGPANCSPSASTPSSTCTPPSTAPAAPTTAPASSPASPTAPPPRPASTPSTAPNASPTPPNSTSSSTASTAANSGPSAASPPPTPPAKNATNAPPAPAKSAAPCTNVPHPAARLPNSHSPPGRHPPTCCTQRTITLPGTRRPQKPATPLLGHPRAGSPPSPAAPASKAGSATSKATTPKASPAARSASPASPKPPSCSASTPPPPTCASSASGPRRHTGTPHREPDPTSDSPAPAPHGPRATREPDSPARPNAPLFRGAPPSRARTRRACGRRMPSSAVPAAGRKRKHRASSRTATASAAPTPKAAPPQANLAQEPASGPLS